MVRDLSDPHEFARRNQAALRRTKTPTTAQRTAVDRGAFRVKSPEGMEVGTVEDPNGSGTVYGTWTILGLLEVLGQLTGSGSLDWTGPATIAGALSVTGPWTISGDGDITGDVDVTGDFEVLGGGRIKVGNVVLTPGDGGRITIGTGAQQIILDPSQFKVGPAFRMDPAHATNGAQLEFGPGAEARVYGGDDQLSMVFQDGDTTRGINLTPGGIEVNGVETLPAGQGAQYLVLGADGRLYTTAGVGGGGDGTPGPAAGDFMWPFDPSSTNPVIGMYGMRVNPVSGQYLMHLGRDFTVPGGSPIPSIGDGTVEEVTFGAGTGNRIRINHGGGLASEYFHMIAASPLAMGSMVSRGDIIGAVGSTGNSTGDHLHLQIWQNGGWVDPTLFFEAQSQ